MPERKEATDVRVNELNEQYIRQKNEVFRIPYSVFRIRKVYKEMTQESAQN